MHICSSKTQNKVLVMPAVFGGFTVLEKSKRLVVRATGGAPGGLSELPGEGPDRCSPLVVSAGGA